MLHNKDYLYTIESATGTSGAPRAGCYTCLSLADQKHLMLQRVSKNFWHQIMTVCYIISISMHRRYLSICIKVTHNWLDKWRRRVLQSSKIKTIRIGKRLEHLPSTFSDFIIVNGLISTAAVIVTHSMHKVSLDVFSPKCVLQSPSVCLEFLRNDTGFPLTRSDLCSIGASLSLPLSLFLRSISITLSLPPSVSYPGPGRFCVRHGRGWSA